ncbi:MAG: metallophosphoesterase family protein, partial [Kiritimatiellia bacterium]
IRCIAVSGNHDAASLPDLAARLPEAAFTLLGKNGVWERITLHKNGLPQLHIDGWSFPSASVREDPTLHYPAAGEPDGIPVLGMVHGDPGVPDSHYAPLSLSRLQSLPVSAWLLGHIHRPLLTPGSPWVLMPGSPHPLDPGEPGAHHAWICELKEGSLQAPVPFCPAALRYEQIDVEFQPQDPVSVEWISSRIEDSLQRFPSVAHLLLRVRFTGVCQDLSLLESLIQNFADWQMKGVAIESVRLDAHPPLNLDEIASAGPVQALLVEALKEMPEDLRQRLEGICQSIRFQSEFSDKSLPPFDLQDLPVPQLLEKVLRKTREQLP